jgi:hypothetical protein
MKHNATNSAPEFLGDPDKLMDFAKINKLSVEAAQEILNRLIEKPEISEEFKNYVFSESRSEDFKGYTSGEATGYSRGHDAGFAKGAMLGVLATIGVVTFLLSKK